MTQKEKQGGEVGIKGIIAEYDGEIDEPEGKITIQISLTLLREINAALEQQETETIIKIKEKSNE